jgi:subtilisin family serine protease
MRLLCVLCFALIAASPALAQQLTHVQGEILVQFKPGVTPASNMEKIGRLRGYPPSFRPVQCLAEEMNLWKVYFDWTKVDEKPLLEAIRRDPLVEMAQFNHIAYLRSALPNDPRFQDQWYFQNIGQSGGTPGIDLQMPLAWDISTGGISPGNDTIVLCIIDNGLDTAHLDLRPNLWTNHGEIPNNQVDDDNNGYVDDYYGWNTIRNNAQISDANYHGTPVSGIAGARGNNGTGITGVNWNVKIMHVVGGFGAVSEDRIIQAYLYAYRQRKRYNDSRGKEGAFVVATNASWGISRAKPADYPIWCAFYDSLGRQGIINIAATETSQDIDVDAVGDMPTGCGSNYLITVNSVDHKGMKAPGGFGLFSIDLGAFGENVLSTTPNNGYGIEKGTSFAAPQVTGAVGLLYAAKCPSLAVLAETDPPGAALFIKSLLLAGVEPTPALQGKTVTGGRLNIFNSLRLLLGTCSDCPPPSRLSAENIRETTADISWITNDSIARLDLRWRRTGTTAWTTVANVRAPVVLAGLSACTPYEVQVKTVCRSDSTGFGASLLFTTDGCCVPPQGVQIPFISERDALVNWDAVTAAKGYSVRYRIKGSPDWLTATTAFNNIGLRNLTACKDYEFQIRTECEAGQGSAFGPLVSFRSRGCGACLELNYCKPNNVTLENAAQEWIARVKIHDFEHRSGKNGYGDFTGLKTTTLQPGNLYSLSLAPGFPSFSSQEHWTVWIDYNQDGFLTSQETAFDSGQAFRDSVSGIVNVPATAKTGVTRMRVVMRFRIPGAACSFSNDFFGEVEDYCISIGAVSASRQIMLPYTARVFPNPFSGQARLQVEFPRAQEWLQVEVFTLQGQLVHSAHQKKVAAGLLELDMGDKGWPSGTYIARLSTPDGVLTRKIIKITE